MWDCTHRSYRLWTNQTDIRRHHHHSRHRRRLRLPYPFHQHYLADGSPVYHQSGNADCLLAVVAERTELGLVGVEAAILWEWQVLPMYCRNLFK